MQCTTHPDATATGACSYSGKPYCGDCLVEVEGRYVAKPNLDKVLAEAREKSGPGTPMVFMNAGGAAAASATASTATPSPMTMVGLVSVPFYRKRWFMVLGCATPILAPFAFLSAITGPLYWFGDNGTWLRVSGGGKALYIIWAIFGTCFLAAL